MKINWQEWNGPFRDNNNVEGSFYHSQFFTSGIVIEFENGKQILVGNVNPSMGYCGCCQYFDCYDLKVARFAVVWEG